MALNSCSLLTFKGYQRNQYTDGEWERHIENISTHIENNLLDQDSIGMIEYADVYSWLHGRELSSAGQIQHRDRLSKKRPAETEIIGYDSKKMKI